MKILTFSELISHRMKMISFDYIHLDCFSSLGELTRDFVSKTHICIFWSGESQAAGQLFFLKGIIGVPGARAQYHGSSVDSWEIWWTLHFIPKCLISFWVLYSACWKSQVDISKLPGQMCLNNKLLGWEKWTKSSRFTIIWHIPASLLQENKGGSLGT